MAYIDNEKTVAVPTSVTAGAATDVRQFNGFTVYMTSNGTATYQLQISADGTNFVNEGTALTAAGNVDVTEKAAFVRWNCTAYTNGTPTSTICGYRS